MDQTGSTWQDLDTLSQTQGGPRPMPEVRVPGLTILAHPEARRIGERTALPALGSGRDVDLSRLSPEFGAPGEGRKRRPLADPHLSRKPLRLAPVPGGGVSLRTNGSRTRVEVEGVPVVEERRISAAELEHGVVLLLADRVTLLLHVLDASPPVPAQHFGLVGESAGILAVRQQIARVADLDVPALVRGETGTGKELVAEGIHRASRRRAGPFVAVNMGALPPSLAAAELFGVAKGAFTGADRRRAGYFGRARGGTLFLDEIGETPPEVQVMLLRTLETGEIQPVGAEAAQKADVRVVAATDAPLEAEIESGQFRAPLLHRLAGYEIWLPPLRHRRDDIGRLLKYFLDQELDALGESWRLHGTPERSFLPAPLVARLASYTWPGNVRQLRNLARQLVIENRASARLSITPRIEALLAAEESTADDSETGSGTLGVGLAVAEEEPALAAAEREPAAASPVGPSAAATPEIARLASDRAVVRTLLVTELAGSTRLFDTLGDRQAFEVLARHDREARRILAEYDGLEIDKADGFLLLFERPAEAVGYALEYHEFLTELTEELSLRELGLALEARAGIHVGEIFLRPNAPAEVARGAKALEVEGLAKPLAARLMALSKRGQTLLTRAACELARQAAKGDHPLAAPEVRWLSHGSYRFKGLSAPIEVFEVGVEGVAPLTAPDGSASAARTGTPAEFASAAKAAGKRSASGPGAESTPSRPRYRSPDEVGEDELLAALKAHAFRLQPAAAALGVSRTSLYALIEKSPRIRKARDLSREEIERCRERHGGDLDRMAAELEVSRKGLRRRMTQLELD